MAAETYLTAAESKLVVDAVRRHMTTLRMAVEHCLRAGPPRGRYRAEHEAHIAKMHAEIMALEAVRAKLEGGAGRRPKKTPAPVSAGKGE